MFITSKYAGYNRHGDQVAAGLFLILMEPKNDSGKFPYTRDACQECGRDRAVHDAPLSPDVQEIADKMHRIWKYLFTLRTSEDSETLRDAVEVILDAQRRVTGCRYFRAQSVNYPIRAIVRHTSLRQLGHFMMGFARVGGHRITLSGSYGADGLTCRVPDEVYSGHGMVLPAELREAWAKGEGWNSAGNEAPLMRSWALANLAELRK